MTTKTLTGTYASGYAITAPTTLLSISSAGYVEGAGITSPRSGSVAYAIVNDGTVKADVQDTDFGIYLYSGGSVTNGAATIKTAAISGAVGVVIGGSAGTVANDGTIQGLGNSTGASLGSGVLLLAGGSVTNGASADTTALIVGNSAAVSIYGQAGTVRNFGTLEGTNQETGADYTGPTGTAAVYLQAGGSIINGSATDHGAVIQNHYLRGGATDATSAIEAKTKAATVRNYGAIDAVGLANFDPSHDAYVVSAAIELKVGGSVTNGTATDIKASIDGAYGVVIDSARGTVVNNGFIAGRFGLGGTYGYTGRGVILNDGGVVTNGSGADGAAYVYGVNLGVGVYGAAGTVRNFGTITANEIVHSGSIGPIHHMNTGVYLASGDLTNGSAQDGAAVIQAVLGVDLAGAGVVSNYGTIYGAMAAVRFSSSADKLVVGAGAVFESYLNGNTEGYVFGHGGTLDLASGAGQIGAMLQGGVFVHTSMEDAYFSDFGTVEIGKSAQFTLAGNGATGAGEVATLDILGELIVAGSLASAGEITGAGTLSLQGGQTSFHTGNSLLVARVAVSGAVTSVEVATNLAYAKAWDQTAGTVSVASGDRLTFTGSGDSFAGTLTGAGGVAFSGGADTFDGLTLSAASQTISKSTNVTLSGAIDIIGVLTATTPHLVIAAGGASLTGGGELLLTDTASNAITGASASAKLTNVSDRLVGAGMLGNGRMTLVNDAGGIIDAYDTLGLTLNTETQTITNAGLIETTGSGGLTVLSPVNNTGTLTAIKGVLTLSGAVSGSGVARIAGGAADFGGTFTENVVFGTSGELELAHSLTYTGTISGFSKTGTTSLDLLDIAFGGSTKATFSGTTTSGVLTVTNGAHTAKIKLAGDYTTSTFTVANDGRGGTKVVDPTGPAITAQAFVAAMAGFGASEAVMSGRPDAYTEVTPSLLHSPNPASG